jgi:hypothetical protein
MTDEEQRKIFAKNLNYYISNSGKQQKEVAEELGFPQTTFKEPSEEFLEIVAKLGTDDEQFQKIIIDYYHMSTEKKKVFCEFFNTFVSGN